MHKIFVSSHWFDMHICPAICFSDFARMCCEDTKETMVGLRHRWLHSHHILYGKVLNLSASWVLHRTWKKPFFYDLLSLLSTFSASLGGQSLVILGYVETTEELCLPGPRPKNFYARGPQVVKGWWNIFWVQLCLRGTDMLQWLDFSVLAHNDLQRQYIPRGFWQNATPMLVIEFHV